MIRSDGIRISAYCLMPNHYHLLFRRDRLKEIGELFGIEKYSSVSSMIEGTKQRLKTDRSFRKRINDMYRSIIKSQKQTGPLFNKPPVAEILNYD